MPKQPLLSKDDVARGISALSGWSREGDAITKTFKFNGFPESVDFVQRLVEPAEKMEHHPDVDVRYDKVTLTLSTHDSGGITKNDLDLARTADELQELPVGG